MTPLVYLIRPSDPAAVIGEAEVKYLNETTMNTLPYQQAFTRIRAEFLELPGMQLTPSQVERLSGVERSICKCALDDLVRAGFLCVSGNGSYRRSSETFTERPRLRDSDRPATETVSA